MRKDSVLGFLSPQTPLIQECPAETDEGEGSLAQEVGDAPVAPQAGVGVSGVWGERTNT